MAEKIYIYRIYFPTSGKSYIGQTIDLQRRLEEHLGGKYLIGNALRKYDDWYECISVLHTCKSRDEANKVEIEEIRNYNSVAPNGYNLTHGGGGIIASDITREKMSQSQLGNQNGKGNLGHKTTNETREKISKTGLGNQRALGYKHSEETKERMRQASLGNQNSKGHIWQSTEETREKNRLISLGNQNAKGYKHSEESKEKMRKPRSERVKLNMRLAQLKYSMKNLERELDNE